MHTLNPVKAVLICLLICVFFFFGCESEKYPGPPIPHIPVATTVLKSVYNSSASITLSSAVWKTADYFVVPLSNLSINKTDPNDGVLNSTGTYTGLDAFGDTAKLILRSVYTNNTLYILAEWQDATLDAAGRKLLWNGPDDPLKGDDPANWTTQNNDDKLILKFKYPSSPTYDEDIWVWSVALSDPLGYAIDMVSKTDQSVVNDAGTPMFARNSDGFRSKPLYEFNGQVQTVTKGNASSGLLDAGYYLYNKTAYTGDPVAGNVPYHNTCFNCHGEGANVGYAPQLNQPWFNAMSREAIKAFTTDPSLHEDGYSDVLALSDVQFDNTLAWIRGQAGVQAYYLQTPNGSVADVFASSTVKTGKIVYLNKGGYKVLLSRKLNTGNADDVTFDTKNGNMYTIGIELCNRDSVNAVGAINQTLVFKSSQDEN